MLQVAGEQRASARAFWPGEDQRPAYASEYGFLLGSCLDEATLARAIAIADRTGIYPHDVLIAHGWVKAEAYYRALAEDLGVPFEPRPNGASIEAPSPAATPRDCLAKGLIKERSRTQRLLFAPDRLRPATLREVLARLRPRDVALAPPHAVRRAIYYHFRDSFAHDAIEALAERHPERSARSPLALWQRWTLALGAAGLLGALLAAPVMTITAVTLALAVAFLPIIGLRIIAAVDLLRKGAAVAEPETCARLSDAELPVYTLLVPLLREANVLPALVQTLSRLDYPAAKLDIKLILEAADGDTLAVARALDLPGNCEVVIVPDLAPRTKPKAMNYALPLARGEYLAIYDAEDRPERDQLRRAVHAFRQGAPNLAVVQARLNIYNIADNWLTRHSPSNIPPCSTACCRAWNGWECPSPSAAPPIISVFRR